MVRSSSNVLTIAYCRSSATKMRTMCLTCMPADEYVQIICTTQNNCMYVLIEQKTDHKYLRSKLTHVHAF